MKDTIPIVEHIIGHLETWCRNWIIIANAIAIPADEVAERLDEIPKDKPVYIHCSTGIRAEMAYVALKENGYKAQFLDANITVADNGTYEITEK